MIRFSGRVTLNRGALLGVVGAMAVSAVCTSGQASEAKAAGKVPSFDVMSVKPNKTGDHSISIEVTPDGFRASNVTADFLLLQANGLNPDQLFGEPGWAKSDTFDVEAKVAGPDVAAMKDLTFEQRQSMFQQILDARFQLKAHHETRDMQVYELVVAKGGPKLTASKAEGGADGKSGGGTIRVLRGNISVKNSNLSTLVSMLSRQMRRTIIDKTGLTSTYDFALVWTPDDAVGGDGSRPGGAGAPTSTEESGPSVFTALEEQMGLKLVASKGPVDVIVVDSIEKPGEN